VEGVVEGDEEEGESRASVEPEGVERGVENDGGEDIGEHDGVEPHSVEGVVDEDEEEEEEGHGGQGIGAAIHEDMECDHGSGDDDGGHVSKDSS